MYVGPVKPLYGGHPLTHLTSSDIPSYETIVKFFNSSFVKLISKVGNNHGLIRCRYDVSHAFSGGAFHLDQAKYKFWEIMEGKSLSYWPDNSHCTSFFPLKPTILFCPYSMSL
jgi:hypothetical protein